MALVAQSQVATFTTPASGAALLSMVVRGNFNTIQAAYNIHDADPSIHVQQSTIAGRPAASVANRLWFTTDESLLYVDSGAVWSQLAFARGGPNTLTVNGHTFTYPAGQGAAGNILQNNGADTLSWVAAGAATFPLSGATQASPTAPVADNATMFLRSVAGAGSETRPHVIPANFRPYAVQPSFMRERAWDAVTWWNNVAQVAQVGMVNGGQFGSQTNATNTVLAAAVTIPGQQYGLSLIAFADAATTSAYQHIVNTRCYLGNAAGRGGFLLMTRYRAISTPFAGARAFFGIEDNAGATGLLVTQDTSPSFDHHGFMYSNALGANWRIRTGSNAAQAAMVDTTVPYTTSHTYDLYLWAAPNSTTVYWRIVDLTANTETVGSNVSSMRAQSTYGNLYSPRIKVAVGAPSPFTAHVGALYYEQEDLYGL